MSYNFTTMNEATSSNSVEVIPNKTNQKIVRLQRVLDYAERKYQCEFSIKFKKQMVKIIRDEKHKSCKIPTEKAVDALVREWKVWEQYVSPESFSEFIADGIKSIFEIEASATFHSISLIGYIGNKARVIKELPSVLATSVSSNGILKINGRMVS